MGSQSEAAGTYWAGLEILYKMSGYNWKWPQIPSLTAMKYQRHGYVERRPFEIGDRQLRRDLDKAREDLLLSTEVQSPHLLKDNFFKVDFYKPVVASKTSKVGGTYRANTIGRIGFFMHH